ncbi:hypothetical protein HanXRQr2_Chr02g0053101 [Helianthus annuus]|uniref:Disease resistance protein Roq1-like winged-helix domain-containing protein n=2 Tax=Helianthus annuus TaxID=4232 RepID=A0A9K3NY07_HELAN|nr:hypothetical protein HanXRQr2_Chr02g0053101 [Helianthus annuus]
MEIFEACSYHPNIGIKVLQQRALITIVDGKFDMHDFVQEIGYHIARGEHPNSPEKRSRLWNSEEIRNMYLGDATMENDKVEAIQYLYPPNDHSSSLFCKIVSNMKKLRLLNVGLLEYHNLKGPTFLSNELRCIYWDGYPTSPFPNNFQPMKLVVLKLTNSLQKELWKGYKDIPHLKV